MAGGYPLRVNGVRLLTSEALYQACRFPHLPDVQRLIIEQRSPMTAKMKSKPHRRNSRPDWDQVRVKIMRWCLRVKLAQNWRAFSELLLETGDRPIVEESRKDDFWGAKPSEERLLIGMNVLGRLLMELREAVKNESRDLLLRVEPISIPDFLLGGHAIDAVTSADSELPTVATLPPRQPARPVVGSRTLAQPSLFDIPVDIVVEPTLPRVTPAISHRGVRIAELKPYPAYRTAEGGWLGTIPSHWTVRRMKYVVREVDSRSTSGREQLLRVSQYTGVTQRRRADGGDEPDTRAASLVGYKQVEPNDLVINIMLAWNGSLGVSHHPGITSPAYCVYRFGPDLHPWYFHNLLRTPIYKTRIKASSTGVVESRLRLYSDDLGRIEGLVPPPEEQAAIVRFLDWANGRLERAIRAKRKVIALLTEQKQAIIHRAVTRGLDPTVPLKPSGTPWLGDIPQHWELWRISRFARVGNGSTPSRGKPAYWNGGTYPWLNSSQVNRQFIDSADQFVTQTALRECHLPKVPAGSVLVAITGQGKTRGLSALLGIEATISQHVAFIAPRVPVASPEYIHIALNAAYRQLRALSEDAGSTKGAITCEDLKRFKVAIPPRPEQLELLMHVDTETHSITSAASRLEREIELLSEYRTRLIADVVTGKLDVREAAARLPLEVSQSNSAEPDDADDEAESVDEEVDA